MPAHLFVDLVAVVALVVLLGVAFARPSAWVEVVVGPAAAGAVVATGAVGLHEAWEQVRLLFPVVAFLAAILVVAELCARAGVFAAVGGLVATAGRNRPGRLLALTFLAAAVTTATLSLDATVVLLTPVVAAAATGSGTSPRPVVHACARLANSASLLLPVSNLTNLLALPSLPSVSFLGFAVVMAPVWVAVIAVEYVGHRVYFAADLARPAAPGGEHDPAARRLPAFSVAVVAVMLVGFAVLSPLGIEPAWVAGAAAVVLAGHALTGRQVRLGAVLAATNLPFALFVLCLGVVVAGLAASFLGDVVRSLLPSDDGLGSLLVVALVATVLANLVNNLPATLLLVPLVAPLGVTALLAALVGLGAGSGLTYTGSLANLLWRRTLTPGGTTRLGRDFHQLSAMVTLPAVTLGVVVLWAWAPVVR